MPLLGTSALVVAFAAALFTVVLGAMGGHLQSRRYAELSRLSLLVTTGCIVMASGALMYAFVSHDFSLRYVAGRSDLRMPIGYVLASFWGGQEGSLLFWVTMSATFGAGAAWVNRDRIPQIMPWYHAVLAAALAGLLFILVFITPPFTTFYVVDAPLDGEGLNPLLQNPLMTIHPPMLLGGFATFVVPYAFGMAALLARDLSADWLRATRKWVLVSWMMLSVGNILGGMWAYRELGWGGYWAWDPVENAALVPWFAASAYLHSVIIQEQRGMFRRWNAILVALTFLLTILGTWMTRSGLIESVHTFAESDIGDYFLALLLIMIAFSAYVISSRWKMLESDHQLDSTVSREGAFLLNNWMFIGIGFVVLWGTLFPKFKEMVTGDAVAIGPAWFDRYTAPLGIALLALMALGTLLPWRRTTLASLRRNFTWPTAISALIVPSTAMLYVSTRGQALGVDVFTTGFALALLCWALIVFNVITLGIEFMRGTRAKMRSADTDALSAFSSLLSKHRRRYGGYTVHLGIVMIFLAFIGNVVKADVDATLRMGESVAFGDYEARFDSIEEIDAIDKFETHANITLFRNGVEVGSLHPSRYDFNDYAMLAGERGDPMKVTSEIYIRSTPLEDVYVAFLHYDAQENAAAFKLVVLPFTWWFWFGGVVLVAGTLICLWPDEDRVKQQYWRHRALRRLEVAGLAAVIIVPIIVFGGSMNAWASEASEPAPIEAAHDHDAHDGHDHGDEAATSPVAGQLSAEQQRIAYQAFDMVMTTCTGCAGKSLAKASPSCFASNEDRTRIREMVGAGVPLDGILQTFVDERGEEALAVPPNHGVNRLAWFLPLAAMGGGIFMIQRWIRRWTQKGAEALARDGSGAVSLDDERDRAFFEQLDDELAARNG